MFLKVLYFTSLFLSVLTENIGWKNYLTENPIEFHDIPLVWEKGNLTSVPNWLTGIYARNGPGQHTFGSNKRHLNNWFDGFAKLHTFKFDGKNVYYSGKMIESSTYKDSVEKGELVPQITLNPFKNKTEEWTPKEILELTKRLNNQGIGDMSHNGFDNMNPVLWRFGSEENPIYLALTDSAFAQKFDINTLETLELLRPNNAMFVFGGCAHWMREPGTDNSITFRYRGTPLNIFVRDYVEIIRFTPNNTDFKNPEVIATFNPKENSMIHSFSITENYAVLFYYPVYVDGIACLTTEQFHVLNCVKESDDPTEIFIVNLKNGEVQKILSETLFSTHHINAYESKDGNEIILDLSPTPSFALRDYMAMKNILNPLEESLGLSGSTCGDNEVTRYTIYPKKGFVTASTFKNFRNDTFERYMNRFDFPTINEAYRGREYCIVYGWSAFHYSRIALIKKNVCDSTQDKIIYIENHYPSEMQFIANPEAESEDDGVILTITYDGELEQSYFAVVDAVSFTIMDRAWLPHFVPYSAHGMHFPEAKWTLQN